MARFRKSDSNFDHELDQILNRVYKAPVNVSSDLTKDVQKQRLDQDQESSELTAALAKLRETRERSQNTQRLQEEIEALRQQIYQLRALGDEIDALRQRIVELDKQLLNDLEASIKSAML